MNTVENREFDYQAYVRENPPDPSRIRRGTEARRQRLEKKLALHGQALVIAREIGYRQEEAADLGNLGNCYFDIGELATAIAFHEQALVIAREVGYRQGEANQLGSLGNCHSALGDPARAIEFYEQALVIHREIGYRQEEAADLGSLGNCYSALGEPARAIELYEQALVIHREIGYRQGEAGDLGNLGNCYSNLGEPARAIEYHEQALVIAQKIGHRQGEAIHLENLGHVFTDQSEWDKALESYRQAIQIADEIGFPQVQNWGRWGMSLARLYSGDLPQARTVIEQAQKYSCPPNMPNVMTLLGIIALRQQDSDTGKEAFTAAIKEADALLNHSDRNYKALDAKALSLCGLALCEQRPVHMENPVAAFKAAREITDAPGTVARVMRLSEELAKADSEGVLAQVRSAM